MAVETLPDPQLEALGLDDKEPERLWVNAAIDLDAVIYAYADCFHDDEDEYVTVYFINGKSLVIDATLSEFMEEWNAE